jgi:hypothetical protein
MFRLPQPIFFFVIPYAGWILGPAALFVEWVVALGDNRGMRIGDMLANTWVVQPRPDAADTARGPAPPTAALPAEPGEKQD